MSPLLHWNEPLAAPKPAVEQRFQELKAIWLRETNHLSSYTKIVNHPAFQEIVALGDAIVPLMLRDLVQGPELWVWALPDLTGADPVPEADRGNIAKMSEAWVRWGQIRLCA